MEGVGQTALEDSDRLWIEMVSNVANEWFGIMAFPEMEIHYYRCGADRSERFQSITNVIILVKKICYH